MRIGRTISTMRKLKNIKQNELAAQLNVSPSSLSLIENGKRSVNFDMIEQIANILGVPVMFMFIDALEPEERKAMPEDVLSKLDSWRMNEWAGLLTT